MSAAKKTRRQTRQQNKAGWRAAGEALDAGTRHRVDAMHAVALQEAGKHGARFLQTGDPAELELAREMLCTHTRGDSLLLFRIMSALERIADALHTTTWDGKSTGAPIADVLNRKDGVS